AIATIGVIVSLIYFLWRLFVLAKRHLLWRVRRKLIISYIFMGVVPAMLIIGFFVLAASIVSMSLSAYLFKDGYDAIVEDVGLVAQAAAAEIGREPARLRETLTSNYNAAFRRYPDLSLAFIPREGSPTRPFKSARGSTNLRPRFPPGRWMGSREPSPFRVRTRPAKCCS